MLCSCCAGASSSSKSWVNILDAPVTLSIAATKALLSAILSTLFCWLNISHGSRAPFTSFLPFTILSHRSLCPCLLNLHPPTCRQTAAPLNSQHLQPLPLARYPCKGSTLPRNGRTAYLDRLSPGC